MVNDVLLYMYMYRMCDEINGVVKRKVGNMIYEDSMEIVDGMNTMLEGMGSEWMIEEDSIGDVGVCSRVML